jgi:SH3-like domain-containing protein
MAYLENWEKFLIGVVVAVLIVFGMMTVFSQINYGSPLTVFSGNIPSKKQIKTEQPPPPIQTIKATVKQDLNFRPAPNTNNTPYYILKSGAKVNVISVQNGWAKIIDNSDQEGYVDNNFLRY